MMDYEFMAEDNPPSITMMYQDISEEFKIKNLDTSYFDFERIEGQTSCPRLKAVWKLLCENFDLYYATRDIGGFSEYDFFCMMQSCLNRNADTFERQLTVYDDDIANPILGRTEKVTYDTLDENKTDATSELNHGLISTKTHGGEEIDHHVEVPADNQYYDIDRTRDVIEFKDRATTVADTGTDRTLDSADQSKKTTGTVTTELSDLGVRPNYEALNGFLDNNRSFIQEFINKFEECFTPRYRRVFF